VTAVDPDLLTVVGVGAGGWVDLPGTHRAALTEAEVVLGSRRQLDLLPSSVTARRVAWPSPLLPALPGLLSSFPERRIAVLASGDPMFHGIGATLTRLVGPVRILSSPSSVSLAAARLGWALPGVEVVSLVSTPVAALHPALNPGRHVLVLGARDPAEVASLLVSRGFGSAELTVLSQLGGPDEKVTSSSAESWAPAEVDPLSVVAIACGSGPATPVTSGLPDDLYETDGQLTKREVRAVTLALLSPAPGELLWDVGAGSGSIGIEWMRAHRSCRAVAIECDAARASVIGANAARLGVPSLSVVQGRAPSALAGLPNPDVVFIGGGLTGDGVLEACLEALPPGGRLVANAVTLESEAVLTGRHGKLGGSLTRIAVQRAKPVGGFTGWQTMMPVTIWAVVKP
jgi:precorrin-6Y C5,15-methyltransferase (decarboxylating)